MLTEERKIQIRDNYNRVLERIENAKAHRNAGEGDVTLLAATKTVPSEEILYAINELGLTHVGENKVQEFGTKYEDLKGKAELHIIGHLQTNKVRNIVGKVDMIQSVDSLHLAQEISKRSVSLGVTTNVLCEINIGEEENKGGVLPANALELCDQIEELPGICLKGMMTMAPVCEKKDDYKKYFSKTYTLYIDFLRKKRHNIVEYMLSMGMSDSYEAAIEEGASMIRVGSTIFGARYYGESK